jgi:hypothetical protein
MIMYAGFLWMTASGNTGQVSEARSHIQNALFGLVLVLSPVIVFSFINPQILNLNFDFSKIAPSNGTTSAPQQTAPATPPKNNLGQTDTCKNNAGGCTIAPSSKIASTGQVNSACTQIGNGQIITSGDAQQESCCAHQTSNYGGNTFVQCQVQAQRREVNGNAISTEYCGCSINTNLVVDYYEVFNNQQQDIGIAPGNLSAYNTFVNACTTAGGKAFTNVISGNFLNPRIACPTNLNITNASSNKCEQKELSCENQ